MSCVRDHTRAHGHMHQLWFHAVVCFGICVDHLSFPHTSRNQHHARADTGDTVISILDTHILVSIGSV